MSEYPPLSDLEPQIEELRYPADKIEEVIRNAVINGTFVSPRGLQQLNYIKNHNKLTSSRKNILDIGCGDTGTIDDPHQEFPGSIITGIDPRVNAEFNPTYNSADHLIRGVIERLPVQSNGFDIVFSSWAFPLHVTNNRYDLGLYEVLRAMGPDGETILTPVSNELFSEKTIKALQSAGFSVQYGKAGLSDHYIHLRLNAEVRTPKVKNFALLQFARSVDLRSQVQRLASQ